MSKHLERRLLNVEGANRRIHLAGIPPLYVRYVGDEDLRPYGATEFEQARYTAIIDRLIAHADALVAEHGPGILRTHHIAYRRNDVYEVLTMDDLEFMEYLITAYQLTDDQDAA